MVIINWGNEKYDSFEDIEYDQITTLVYVGRETSESCIIICKISIIVGLIRNKICISRIVEKEIERGNISIENYLRLKNYINVNYCVKKKCDLI